MRRRVEVGIGGEEKIYEWRQEEKKMRGKKTLKRERKREMGKGVE